MLAVLEESASGFVFEPAGDDVQPGKRMAATMIRTASTLRERRAPGPLLPMQKPSSSRTAIFPLRFLRLPADPPAGIAFQLRRGPRFGPRSNNRAAAARVWIRRQ